LVVKPKGKYRSEILDVDGKTILKWAWRKLDGDSGLIHLAQKWDQWQSLLNKEVDLWVP